MDRETKNNKRNELNYYSYDDYVVFAVHNTVITYIESFRGNELILHNLVGLMNSCRNSCVDYRLCLAKEFPWQGHKEIDYNNSSEKDWYDKYCS